MHGEIPLNQTLVLEEREENFRILQGYANENDHDTVRSDGDTAQIEQKLRRTTENNTKASIYLFISSFICNENSRPLSRFAVTQIQCTNINNFTPGQKYNSLWIF